MILVVVGPTAVGKSKMSIELAKIYNGEIINADSMQIYESLDIGTAKITKSEMEKIPHHLLSIKNVTEDYSVYDYQKDARRAIEEIKSRGKIPVIVGGTGYYIKAALYDYQFSEDDEMMDTYENLTNEDLIEKIKSYETGVTIDFQNRRRLVRLLQKLESGDFSFYSDFKLLYDDVFFIGLTTDRDELYKRIDTRLDNMLVPLIDEVKPFYLQNIRSKSLMTGIGYKELYAFFDNVKTLQEVLIEMKQNSRHYAKRQFTWFQNQMQIEWFSVCYDDFKKTVLEVVNYIEQKKN